MYPSDPLTPRLILPSTSRSLCKVVDFSLNDNTYALGQKLRDLKLIVNPDFVGCIIMHWAGCGTGDSPSPLAIDDEMSRHYPRTYRTYLTLFTIQQEWGTMRSFIIARLIK